MDCCGFLERYSDYRDGLLSAAEMAGVRAHLAACEACARHDRVVGSGVDLLLRMNEIRPSRDFGIRLRHRLLALQREMEAGGPSLAARRSSSYPLMRP